MLPVVSWLESRKLVDNGQRANLAGQHDARKENGNVRDDLRIHALFSPFVTESGRNRFGKPFDEIATTRQALIHPRLPGGATALVVIHHTVMVASSPRAGAT